MSPSSKSKILPSSVTVSIPGTTANVGPGFDSFGIALGVSNLVTVAQVKKPVPLPSMVETTADSFFLGSGLTPFPFSWKIKGNVPQARGLGSSVTVRLGTLMGLNALCGNALSHHGLFRLCAELEGHPDNAAPAMFGGFSVTRAHHDPLRYEVSSKLAFVLLIPSFEVATPDARRVMPKSISVADAAANAACHLTFLSIVNRLGNVDAAAHAVAVTIESLAFLPGSAFQVAAATLAGQALGARDERRARQGVWLAAGSAALLMGLVGAAFFRYAAPLSAWFAGGGAGAEVADLAAALVRIVAFAQPPLALLMVLSGGLRGGGATRPPLVVNFLGLVAVRLPLALLLACGEVHLPGGFGVLEGMGLGARGAWLAMAADLTIRGLAMAAIVARPGWTRVRV